MDEDKTKRDMYEFARVLSLCQAEHPEGYTIVDFQQVWLQQNEVRISKLESRLSIALAALREIREHEHCQYSSESLRDHAGSNDKLAASHLYQTGVADGHRCCAAIADRAIKEVEE